VQVVVYVVGAYDAPAVNPADDLVSDSSTYLDCYDEMLAVLADAGNVSVLKTECGSLDEYYEDFFRSDHHWTIRGALKAYAQICTALDLEEKDFGGFTTIPDVVFTGATARWSLDLVSEQVEDLVEAFDYLTMADGAVSAADHSALFDLNPLAKKYSVYDMYFNNVPGGLIEGGDGERNVLLVANSYMGALQRPLASSLHALTTAEALHPSHADLLAGGLSAAVADAGADAVVFVASPADYAIFGNAHADLLE
jgi:hypothetical protein